MLLCTKRRSTVLYCCILLFGWKYSLEIVIQYHPKYYPILLINRIKLLYKDYCIENQRNENNICKCGCKCEHCNVVLYMYLFLLQVLYKLLPKHFWRDSTFPSCLSIWTLGIHVYWSCMRGTILASVLWKQGHSIQNPMSYFNKRMCIHVCACNTLSFIKLLLCSSNYNCALRYPESPHQAV